MMHQNQNSRNKSAFSRYEDISIHNRNASWRSSVFSESGSSGFPVTAITMRILYSYDREKVISSLRNAPMVNEWVLSICVVVGLFALVALPIWLSGRW